MRRILGVLGALAVAAGLLGGGKPAEAHGSGGYWMLGVDGVVYAFGAPHCGNTSLLIDVNYDPAVDIEPHPDGRGYWTLQTDGWVESHRCADDFEYGFGAYVADRLFEGEHTVSLSATPDGEGLWLFTNTGRVIVEGDAQFYGDMGGAALNGPVLDSVSTPSGRGYWMVASDGGIFSFGDAQFYGSMGGQPLNEPVMSMAPDPDGRGYWLVASDGGIFSFEAPFYGSMGSTPLNEPVSGMVASPTGGGYLMVAEDGGIFAFGDVPFHGSLGSSPPAFPVLSVAAKPAGQSTPQSPPPPPPPPPAEQAKVTSLRPIHPEVVHPGDTWGYVASTSGPVESLAVTFLRPDGTNRTKNPLTKQGDGTWVLSQTVGQNWPTGTFTVTGIEINGEPWALPGDVPTQFTVDAGLPQPAAFPPQFLDLTHGGEAWAVVLGASLGGLAPDPALTAQQGEYDRISGYSTSIGDAGCDVGSVPAIAQAMGWPTEGNEIIWSHAVYFASEADARAARQAFEDRGLSVVTVVPVQTLCLD